MKRFLMISGLLWVLAAGAGWVFVTQYLDPKLLEEARARGTAALGKPLQIEDLRTTFFPLGLELTGIRFEEAVLADHLVSLEGRRVRLLSNVSKLIQGSVPIDLSMEGFDVRVLAQKTTKSSPSNSEDPAFDDQMQRIEELAGSREFQILFSISGSKLHYVAKPVQDRVSKTAEYEIQFHELKIQSDLKAGQLDLQLEILKPLRQKAKFSTGFALQQKTVSFQNGQLGMLGFLAQFSGSTDLSSLSNQYQLRANISDLSTLPESETCVRPRQGTLNLDVKLSTGPQFQVVTASGAISTNGQFALDCRHEKGVASGALTLRLQTQFSAKDSAVTLPFLDVEADASKLKIAADGLFQKSDAERLVIRAKGAYQERLNLESFFIQLATLTASGSAILQTDDTSSKINLVIPPVDLKGFERFFPALSSQPLSGRLEVKALIEGPLKSPHRVSIQVNPLKLEGFRTLIRYSDAETKVKADGPVSADLKAIVESLGPNLRSANLSLATDLTGLNLDHPQFRKSANQIFKIRLIGQANRDSLVLKGSEVRLPSGAITIDGSVRDLQNPVLDLMLKTASFDIGKLLEMMPAFSKYLVQGNSNAQLSIQGRYDLKGGIKTSPIRIGGTVVAKLSKVRMPPAPKVDTSSSSQSKELPLPPPREPMFEDSPLYRNLNLNLQADLLAFQMDDLSVSGISSKSLIRSGVLEATANVREIFGGSIQIKSLNYPLLVRAPTIASSGTFKAIEMDKALTWFSKDYQGLVKGLGSGDFAFTIPDRSRKDFFQTLKGVGTAVVTDGFVSTLKFDQLANEKLSKIPGVSKDQRVSSGGARANLQARYSISEGRVNFANLQVLTPERNELQGKGWILLSDKTCDLDATVWLSNPPVGGAIFEANNDGQGRLKVPVRVRGSLLSPDLSIAADVIQSLLSNAARRESDKLKQRLSEQGQQRAKEIGEDFKKEAEKKLKDLFK